MDAYNKGSNRGTRIGNWVEETALEATTGIYRRETWTSLEEDLPPISVSRAVDKTINTSLRTLNHTEQQSFKALRSSTQDALARKRMKAPASSGPRSAMLAESMLQQAKQEIDAEAKIATSTPAQPLASEYCSTFKHSVSNQPRGRRVMKTQNGEHIPPEALVERSRFLTERGILNKVQPTIEGKKVLEAKLNDPSFLDKPITVYSQRAAEGTLYLSETSSQNPFARNAAFTNDLADSKKFHESDWVNCRGQERTQTGNLGAAAELSLLPLISRVQAAVSSRFGMHGFREVERQLLAGCGPADGSTVRHSSLAAVLRGLGVRLQEAEVDQLLALAAPASRGGATVLDVLAALRTRMSAPRRALVRRAFSTLDAGGGGGVRVTSLAQLYNVGANPDVVAGRATEAEALEQMVQQFRELQQEDGIVTAQEFVLYYDNVSACITDDAVFFLTVCSEWGLPSTLMGGGPPCWKLLVTTSSGRQVTVDFPARLGFNVNDTTLLLAALREQGTPAVAVRRL